MDSGKINGLSLEAKYACPICAELVQKEAFSCRYCQANLSWSVALRTRPESYADLAKAIHESFGLEYFRTYGEVRKLLEKKRAVLLHEVHRADAEKMERLIRDSGGMAQIERYEIQGDRVRSNANSLGQRLTLLGALSFVLLGAFFYFKPVKDLRLFSTQSEPEEAVSYGLPNFSELEEPSAEADETQSDFLSGDIKKHLQELISATAVLKDGVITGSAFFVHPDGYLITNAHVTDKMREISVSLRDGRLVPGELIRKQAKNDLALVKISGGPYPVLNLGDATELEQGETVWTIGAPHGLDFTVTKGIVSFVGRKIRGKAYIQADVAINPGNSGGPMINERGEVVGINNFIISNAEGLNFAIPINLIFMGSDPILEGIVKTGPASADFALWLDYESKTPKDTIQSRFSQERNARGKEIQGFLSQINRLQSNFQARSQKEKAETRVLKRKIDEKERRFYSRDLSSLSLTQEQELEKEIGRLRRELLEKELRDLGKTKAYAAEMHGLLDRLKASYAGNPTQKSRVERDLKKFQRLRSDVERKIAENQRQLRRLSI